MIIGQAIPYRKSLGIRCAVRSYFCLAAGSIDCLIWQSGTASTTEILNDHFLCFLCRIIFHDLSCCIFFRFYTLVKQQTLPWNPRWVKERRETRNRCSVTIRPCTRARMEPTRVPRRVLPPHWTAEISRRTCRPLRLMRNLSEDGDGVSLFFSFHFPSTTKTFCIDDV